jgi:Protein of unknown function (DUF2924)
MRKKNMGRQPAAPATEALEAELARITGLGLDELRALWRTMACRSPPAALSRDMLARMIAYRLQEHRLGKLNAGTRKLLDRLAGAAASRSGISRWGPRASRYAA